MGVSTIRFAVLSGIVGALTFAGSASAQQATPAAYAKTTTATKIAPTTTPAPVIYPGADIGADIGAGCTSCGDTASAYTYQPVVSAPAASCGCSSCGGGGGLRDRIGGRGIGSRVGSRCGGGLGECNLGDQWKLFGSACEEPRWNIGGWLQAGYHSESNDLFLSLIHI